MGNNIEKIKGDEILDQYRIVEQAVKVRKRLTPLQAAGMNLALGIGIIGLIVIVGLGIEWLNNSPSIPQLPSNMDALNQEAISNMKTLLESYKVASEIALDGPMKLFDLVVVKVLFPLFTAILGYIFGTRTTATEEEKER